LTYKNQGQYGREPVEGGKKRHYSKKLAGYNHQLTVGLESNVKNGGAN